MAIYAASDFHGQYKAFIKGLETIGFSESDHLYVIGDAIDRGPEGVRLLQYIKDHENMDLLIGNHEFMMLNSVSLDGRPGCGGRDAELWLYYNGGIATYEEYAKLSREKRQALMEWLNDRVVIKPIEVEGKKICLTHSFYKPECENLKYSELKYDDVWEIVWTSIYREDPDSNAEDIYSGYDYTFITGHVPVQRIFMVNAGDEDYNRLAMHKHGNLLCIDGGCAWGKNKDINNGAIFLRLDDMTEFCVPLE